ncbi:hypothetical protein K439DRAFT_1623694 [Ramaria rubella]|nr:hypothetical protein K439DRAFT_1623694 [Ramaria rubella]
MWGSTRIHPSRNSPAAHSRTPRFSPQAPPLPAVASIAFSHQHVSTSPLTKAGSAMAASASRRLQAQAARSDVDWQRKQYVRFRVNIIRMDHRRASVNPVHALEGVTHPT